MKGNVTDKWGKWSAVVTVEAGDSGSEAGTDGRRHRREPF